VLKLTGGHVTAVLAGWEEDSGVMYVGEWTRSLPMRACLEQKPGDDYATTLWRFLRDQSRQHTRINIEAR
jgi:hypothetical protein